MRKRFTEAQITLKRAKQHKTSAISLDSSVFFGDADFTELLLSCEGEVYA